MFALDPLLLARIQFAFTISFHIIFPAFSIGLASFLAVIEWRWLRTANPHFREIYQFWVKIFSIAFGMGVVSGVVMSYEFGTNWSVFSDKVGNVLGPLLAFEVLTAFFLEASFLGIMLFGWGRVSKRMHFTATVIVAIGTLISAFWILSANSWMQTPQGFEIGGDQRLYPINWIQIIFNPSFPYRLIHMVIAAYLTTALTIGGVAAYYLWKDRHLPQAKIMLSMATLMAALVAPLQLFIGDAHGLNTFIHQPAKIAAIEGVWETSRNVPLLLFAIPDQKSHHNKAEVRIPNGASLLLTHKENGEIKGLNEFGENIPPVMPVFYAFRIMVGLGILMILLGITSAIHYFRKTLYRTRWLLAWWMLMMPSGFVALLSGWFVTEIGRQPYVAYGILKTAQAVSPMILAPQVAWSLAAFVLIYLFIFGAGSYYILKLISKGILSVENKDQFYKHSIGASVVESVTSTKGDSHV